VIAASVAVHRDGLFLLAQRARGLASGLWSIPGGHVERGETLAECALRELTEEVGVVARDPRFVQHVEMIGADHHAVICAFVAQWVSGEPQTGPEAAAIAWVRPEQVAGMATTPRLAEVIGRARDVMLAP